MSIKISKFGKIKNAEIALDGLTVIAGQNDTGKSTVGKALYSIIKSIKDYPELYTRFTKKQAIDAIFPLLFELLKQPSKENDLYNRIKNIRNHMVSVALSNKEIPEEIYDSIDDYITSINTYVSSIHPEPKIKETIDQINKKLYNSTTDDEQFKKITTYIFNHNFKGTYNNSVTDEDASIHFSIGNTELTSLEFKKHELTNTTLNAENKANSFREATLIESPLYLERGHTSSLPYAVDLKTKIEKAKKLLPNKSENEDILKQISIILSDGSFSYNEQEDTLKYTVTDSALPLDIENIATGCKSLGILYIFLKTGILLKDSLLILDEPENHLHPDWQIKFAKVLVSMVENGFYILLTSHSPTFIHALTKYSQELITDKKKVNFYLSEKTEDNNYCIIKNVNNSIENIFENLTSPNDILYLG